MKRFLFACTVALAACSPHGAAPSNAASAATTRLEALLADPSDTHCTADRAWCATTDADATTFAFSFHHKQVGVFHLSDGGHEIWPQIIRSPRADGGEDALVGVTHTDQQSYSGGGGQAVFVSLYPLTSNVVATTPPQAALTFPASAALDIRACFSEADTRARHDACSDQYNFTGALALDTSGTPAKLVLTTEATTYPGHLTRSEDNTHPLAASDLKTVRDETCSYRRGCTRNASSHTYTPDAPLPACSDYLEP